MPEAVALSWAPTQVHGWGVFGTHLLREALRLGRPRPIVLAPIEPKLLADEDRVPFDPLRALLRELEERFAQQPGTLLLRRTCALHALGNQLQPSPPSLRYRGEPNVGFTFFERTGFGPDVVARSAWLDGLVAGSTWNADGLRALGFERVRCVLQGVDTDRFRPGPPSGRFGDRFVVFSGCKLELRKGQDQVIAAYRRFHARHPDALLVTVWMNPWPAIMADVAASPHVRGHPEAGPPAQAIGAWVRAQGVPDGAHVDLGCVPNAAMPAVLRECHAAVFASRCEGGTNLVAMEAMATGLPCVVSANSGHLDILGPDHAYALARQSPTRCGPPGSDPWRDSDVDEIVEALESIYTDRERARRRGDAARQAMLRLGWRGQIAALFAALDEMGA